MRPSKRLLGEMFGVGVGFVREAPGTTPGQAEREVNSARSVFGRGPRPTDPRFKKDQTDLDRSRSVAKTDEAEGSATSGLRITGDQATMEALFEVLSEYGQAEHDEDHAEWADDCARALRSGMQAGSVTLPAFKATPDLNSFNDDPGHGPEEEY